MSNNTTLDHRLYVRQQEAVLRARMTAETQAKLDQMYVELVSEHTEKATSALSQPHGFESEFDYLDAIEEAQRRAIEDADEQYEDLAAEEWAWARNSIDVEIHHLRRAEGL